MTNEEIIEMARPRAWHGNVEGWTFNSYEELEAFAKLVAEREREAHRSYIHELERELEVTQDKLNECLVADYMKKSRGQA